MFDTYVYGKSNFYMKNVLTQIQKRISNFKKWNFYQKYY